MAGILRCHRCLDRSRAWSPDGSLESLEVVMCGRGSCRSHSEPMRVGRIESAFAKLYRICGLLWLFAELRRQLLLRMLCWGDGCTTARRCWWRI